MLLAARPPVLQGAAKIIGAKVPIIKCNLVAGAPSRVHLSCGSASP